MLTRHQLEVVRLVCKGYRYKRIAAAMSRSEMTVKHIVAALMKANDLGNIAQLALWANARGYLDEQAQMMEWHQGSHKYVAPIGYEAR